jgi:hypothetical protein
MIGKPVALSPAVEATQSPVNGVGEAGEDRRYGQMNSKLEKVLPLAKTRVRDRAVRIGKMWGPSSRTGPEEFRSAPQDPNC